MTLINNPELIKKFHFFPNAITAFGLICGLFVIFKMAVADVSTHNFEALQAAAIFLLIAAFADLLDGAVARFMRVESEFGIFFDSISDSITFGVAPSVIILQSTELTSDYYFALMTASMVYTVCGALRLVRYSVQALHVQEDDLLAKAHNKNFTGLPIPGAAAAAVSSNLFLASPECQALYPITNDTREILLTALLMLLGYCMTSQWKFPSLKALRIRIKAFPLIVLTVSFAAILLYGILNHFAVVFVSISWGYILCALVLSLARLISGKKSKTLQDFEPEEDEFEI